MTPEAQFILFGLNGLVWGLIIALIALGLSLVFGLIEIINIAHGDLFMLGAVLAAAPLAVGLLPARGTA